MASCTVQMAIAIFHDSLFPLRYFMPAPLKYNLHWEF